MNKKPGFIAFTAVRLTLLVSLLLGPFTAQPATPARASESGPGGPAAPAANNGIFLPLVQKPRGLQLPSAQEKIYAKYEAGEIDYETYLIYRAYALYGDLQLPAELRGRIEEDTTLFFEIEEPQQPLSAATLEKLHPYLVRPDHPDSAVNGQLPLPEAAPGLASPTQDELPANYACSDPDGDGNYWATLDSASLPVRIHRICHNNPGFDKTYVLAGMQKVLTNVETLWAPMTAHMGTEPLLDEGGAQLGGDERIDVYIIARSQVFQRDEPVSFSEFGAAFVRKTPAKEPEEPKAAGIMVLDQDHVNAENGITLKSLVAHELFHLLQYAHNRIVMRNLYGEAYWFSDASAEWAAWHFVPEARKGIHQGRFPEFQNDDLSLNVHGINGSEYQRHNYDAYIWPFFMEQQAGPEAIAAAWDGLVSAQTFTEADAILNGVVSFTSSFHLFALRNLVDKDDFGNAIPNPYLKFDPTFVTGEWPAMKEDITLFINETPHPVPVNLPALTADYYHYEVDPAVKQIVFDFRGVAPADFFDVDALVYVTGVGWQLRQWSGSPRVQLCLDQERISELYLVISNTNHTSEVPVTGEMSVFPRGLGCACENLQEALQDVQGFKGTINFNFEVSASEDDETIYVKQFGNVQANMLHLEDSPQTWMDQSPQGQGHLDWVHTLGNSTLTDAHADGRYTPYREQHLYSRTMVNFYYTTCTYSLHATLYVPGTMGGKPAEIWIASFTSRRIPVDTSSMLLSGGESFPVYSDDYIFDNNPPLFFAEIAMQITDWLGEGTQYAPVSWSLEPVFK